MLENILRADSSISGPKLKKAVPVEEKIGKKLSLRSVQRAKQQLAEVSVASGIVQNHYSYIFPLYTGHSIISFSAQNGYTIIRLQ